MENKQTTTDNEEMTIKIQTLDSIYPLNVKRSSTVSELKDLISSSLSVPVNKQRLIFQGKLLQASERLKTYKITDDNVIHLVAKTIDENAPQAESQTSANLGGGTGDPQRTFNVEDIFSGILEIPIATRARRPRRRRVPHFDISESFESMHQNIATLQNLQQCKNKFDEQQISLTKLITPFDLNRSKFEVGQWIDVKDTIDQWLEAQVVQVRSNQVYVHYNGWGTRWDEWIDFSSPRIASFKTYSQQSPTSVFLSPYPSIIPDANVEPQNRNIDTFYYIDKTVGFLYDIIKQVDHLGKIRKKNARNSDINRQEMRMSDFEETKTNPNPNSNSLGLLNDVGPNLIRTQIMNSHGSPSATVPTNLQLSSSDYELLFYCSQLVPMMDRTGRLLSDISLHFSHLLLNSNLYPQLLLSSSEGVNPTFPDNLSCTSGYSMFTNEGSTVSGLINSQANELSNFNIPRSNSTTFQSIQNSNQMINNYTNLLQNNSSGATGGNASQGVNQSSTALGVGVGAGGSTAVQNSNVGRQPSDDGLGLSHTQYLQQTQTQSNTTTTNTVSLTQTVSRQPNSNTTTNAVNDNSLPKINLQVPAMLSMAEVALVNGHNYNESNIDIYVHTIAAPTRTAPVINTNTVSQAIPSTHSNQNNTQSNHLANTTNYHLTQLGNDATSTAHNNTSHANFNHSRRLIDITQAERGQLSPRERVNTHRSSQQASPNTTNSNVNNSNITNNNRTTLSNEPSETSSILHNILSIFRTVSNASQTTNANNTANVNPSVSSAQVVQTTQQTGSSSNRNSNNSSRVQRNENASNSASAGAAVINRNNLIPNTNNDLLFSNNLVGSTHNKFSKETQTDAMAQEEGNVFSIGDNRSDNYRRYYTKSLKSASDASEFDQFHDEEHSDTKSLKKLDRNDLKSVKSNALSKLNELDESFQSDEEKNLIVENQDDENDKDFSGSNAFNGGANDPEEVFLEKQSSNFEIEVSNIEEKQESEDALERTKEANEEN